MVSYKVTVCGEPCEIEFPDVQYPLTSDSTKEERIEFTEKMNSYLERMYQIRCDKEKVIEPKREETKKAQEETKKAEEETKKSQEETKQEGAKAASKAFEAIKEYAPFFLALVGAGIIGGVAVASDANSNQTSTSSN